MRSVLGAAWPRKDQYLEVCGRHRSVNILAFETTGSKPSVAVLTEGKGVVQEVLGNNRIASSRLTGMLGRVMERAGCSLESIDAYAVSVGPGSFTGTRLGIAAVKGLAVAYPRPAVALSSLECQAYAARHVGSPLIPIVHSHRDWFYVSMFESSGAELKRRVEDSAVTEKELAGFASRTGCASPHAVGCHWNRISIVTLSALAHAGWFLHSERDVQPEAGSCAELALSRLRDGLTVSPRRLMPVYLQSPV